MTIADISYERDRRRQHIQGAAVCLGCRHKFQMIKPVGGADECECPECGLMKAVYTGLVEPEDGAIYWTCNCGSSRFMALTSGCLTLFCEGCGRTHSPDDMVVS